MTFFLNLVSEDVKQLIASIISIDEDDENFYECVKFCLGNFLHHSFINTDERQIWQEYHEMEYKFIIYSQTKKAESLNRLITKFLGCCLGVDKRRHSELHYHCLQFLLNVAISPLKNNYIPKLQEPQDDDNDEKICDNKEWTDIIDVDSSELTYSSSVTSTEEDDGDGKPKYSEPTCVSSELESNGTPISNEDMSVKETCLKLINYRSLLNSNLVSYWRLKEYLGGADHGIVVSEDILTRETVWMLCNRTTFIYNLKGDAYSLKAQVRLIDVNNNTLCEFVKPFCEMSGFIRVISRFIMSSINLSSYMQSFVRLLWECVQAFVSEMLRIEQSIINRGKILTIIELRTKLRDYFSLLKSSAHFIDKLNKLFESDGRGAGAYLFLIHSLYKELEFLYATESGGNLSLFTKFFIASLSPFCEIMNKCLLEWTPVPADNEFGICRSKEVVTVSEGFWQNSYSLLKYPFCETQCLNECIACLVNVSKIAEVLESCEILQKELPNETCLMSKLESILTHVVSCFPHNYLLEHDGVALPGAILQNNSFSESSQSFNHIMNSVFVSEVKSCMNGLSRRFMHELKHKFYLYDMINSFIDYYLSRNGFLNDFCVIIHDAIVVDDRHDWSLIWEAIDTVTNDYNKTDSTMFIPKCSIDTDDLTFDPFHSSDHLNFFDKFSLNFVLDWPLNIYFTSNSLSQYRHIFSFIGKLHYLKFCLERLYQGRKQLYQDEALHKLAHRTYLLFNQLYHFLNTLVSFICYQIHVLCDDYIEKVSNSFDLDCLIVSHTNFLCSLFVVCFLNKNQASVREYLSMFFTLVHQVLLYAYCPEEDSFTLTIIDEFERDFAMIRSFLCVYMAAAAENSLFTQQCSISFLFGFNPQDK